MKKEIGYIGLGKMGLAQVVRLAEKGWRIVAWNRSEGPRTAAKKSGVEVCETLTEVAARFHKPRLIWLMVPHGAVDGVLKELVPHLSQGDTVIDGGNSFYKNSIRRARELARRGIHFLDVGVSGGPFGARSGACLMVGGEKEIFKKHEQLFRALSASQNYSDVLENNRIDRAGTKRSRLNYSYAYMGKSGAGHFVKMVHNGIEYGMMQSIAEGFSILRRADLRGLDADRREKRKLGFNLTQIAELYNRGSVIESRLIGWLAKAFEEHGESLKDVSGEVAQSGEGLWTVQTAKELGVPVKVIEDSLKFRIQSKGNPTNTGQIISALRNQFGGHSVFKKGDF